MKTHLIIDTFFCPGDVVYIGTKQECEDKRYEINRLYSGLDIVEMTEEEKRFYN